MLATGNTRSPGALAFEDAAEHLRESLDALRPLRRRRAAGSRLAAVQWNLERSPTVGFALAEQAVDLMWMVQAKPGTRPDSESYHDLLRAMADDTLANACDGREAYSLGRFALESTARCLHSSGDLLAQLTRTCSTQCRAEQQCSLNRITDGCRSRDCRVQTDPGYAQLHQALRNYHGSPQYVYFERVTNRMKHRDVIGGGLGISLSRSPADRLYLRGFTWEDGKGRHRVRKSSPVTASGTAPPRSATGPEPAGALPFRPRRPPTRAGRRRARLQCASYLGVST
jgi:hypothetical protein